MSRASSVGRWLTDASKVSRFSCRKYLDVPGILDYAGLARELALAFPAVWPSAEVKQRRHPDCGFSKLNSPARRCPCLRFTGHLAVTCAKLGVRMDRYSFPVILLHSHLSAGLSRRIDFVYSDIGLE